MEKLKDMRRSKIVERNGVEIGKEIEIILMEKIKMEIEGIKKISDDGEKLKKVIIEGKKFKEIDEILLVVLKRKMCGIVMKEEEGKKNLNVEGKWRLKNKIENREKRIGKIVEIKVNLRNGIWNMKWGGGKIGRGFRYGERKRIGKGKEWGSIKKIGINGREGKGKKIRKIRKGKMKSVIWRRGKGYEEGKNEKSWKGFKRWWI